MHSKKVIVILNVLLVCAMVIHVGIKMFLHSQNPSNSAPAYVQIINAIYYLIPLLLINVIYFIIKKR